jgi:uncharacterized membrane protein YdbT with pleckstrin-like domain
MDKNSKSQFDDTIIWIDKPVFRAYVKRHILTYKGAFQVLLIGSAISLLASLLNQQMYDWIGFLYFAGILLFVGITQLLLKMIGYNKTRYWITRQAVYIQGGIIKRRVTSIPRTSIIFLDIEMSEIERKCHAGTVLIDCGETKISDGEKQKLFRRLEAIPNPEAVIKLL